MFDRQFQKQWTAANVQIHVDTQLQQYGEDDTKGEEGDVSIMVSWDDCAMADYFINTNPGTVLEYTAEITPDTEIPIKSFQYYKSFIFAPSDRHQGSLEKR